MSSAGNAANVFVIKHVSTYCRFRATCDDVRRLDGRRRSGMAAVAVMFLQHKHPSTRQQGRGVDRSEVRRDDKS